MAEARVHVLGCALDPVTLSSAVERVSTWIESDEPRLGVAVNARKLALRRDSSQVRALLDRADLVFADGASVLAAAWLEGRPLPERVPGVELARALLDRAHTHGWSVALVGGSPEVARILERPDRWTHHGYFQDQDQVVAPLRERRPDLLLVGMGSPRQEAFLLDNPDLARFAMGVGGSLDVLAGVVERAPRWTHRVGLEGAWRIATEPRKRWRRLLDLPRMRPPRDPRWR